MQAPYPMQDPKRPQTLNSGTNVQECRIRVRFDAFDRLRALFSMHLASCKGRSERLTHLIGAQGVTYLYLTIAGVWPAGRICWCCRRLRFFDLDLVGAELAHEGGLTAGLALADVPKFTVGAAGRRSIARDGGLTADQSLAGVHIRFCGNGHLGFRPYDGSLGKAPSNQGLLPLSFGPSLGLGIPSMGRCIKIKSEAANRPAFNP